MTQAEPRVSEPAHNAIAIVGISLHAPGARDAETLWQNLLAGRVLSEPVSDEELRRADVPDRLLRHPRYVRHTLRLPGVREFDPEFFGFTPRDAALIDPQLRHLLECAWEALEDAGIDPARPAGPIGLFVGAGFSEYALHNLLPNRELVETHGLDKLLQLGNDRDFIASRIAYALDLRGPCASVAAACASGALAVHYACQSLLGRECRIALAGGASIQVPHGVGYLYEEGGLGAPDGVCRSFDANAQGTLPSSGCAQVALMRLEDALRERRSIYATILATAVNNDGRRKVGYTAPSVDGPLGGIEEALAVAGVDARSIGYVEAHGTGTPFGDSIEVSALTKAFRQHTDAIGFCVLGANKPNLGHTDAASGVLSLIKAALALKTRQFAPLVNFREPHPLLELASSPFRVVTKATPWGEGHTAAGSARGERINGRARGERPSEADVPRRALVNCLAIGGSNVHMVLEEPPPAPAVAARGDRPELLALSARSPEALAALQRQLAEHLERHPELALRDVAHTLREGRRAFDVRKALLVSSREDAIAQLRGEDARAVSAVPELMRLIELSRRFLEEREPDFATELASEDCRFVHLPSYPFERRACWFEAPRPEAARSTHAPAPNVGVVPYARIKFVDCAPSAAEPKPGQRWLVFVDETGLGQRLVRRLEQRGCEVIRAQLSHGPALTRQSERDYRIDCDRGFEGPLALIAELAREGRLPDVIVLLWTVTTEERFRSATNRFHHDMERGYFTVLAICQGLAALETSSPVRLVAITNGALRADGDPVAFPAKALIFGPLSTVSLEQPNVTPCAIDVQLPIGARRALSLPQLLEHAHDKLVDLILPEAVGRGPGIYALRGDQLRARSFEPVPSHELTRRELRLRPGGAYLVLGGFGNLGHALARELSGRAPVKLVLVGRTPLPDRAYWDEWLSAHPEGEPVSARIRRVRELEARGAEVLALSGDVCHLESMSSVLTLARRRFGAIHGVIHAAGVLSEALCGGATLDQARDALAAEVLGARVLGELLRREKLDFFVLIGSVTRIAPRAGTYARIAAADFADALCDRAGALHPRVFDLALIRDGGMYLRWIREREADGSFPDPQLRALIDAIERGMTTEASARALVDAIGSGERQLLIGPIPRPSSPIATVAFARSELKREYVAPEGELEQQLSALWAEALRIDRVGASDDFFELGGHSLIAVRLGARIKATWGVSVPLALIIEAPTVRQLARVIGQHLKHRGEREGERSLREWSTIVPLQPQGERPPLFCVGGQGGNVMNLRHLATLLGRDQPVCGLQARGVDGAQKPHETFEAMVEEYLADMRRGWPRGPYLLAGFSGGGAMIVEMARRLRAQGHSVGPLLFLDAWNPAAPERTWKEKVRAHGALLREIGPRYAGLLARRVARDRAQELMRTRAPALAERIWDRPVLSGEVVEAWELAASQYRPQPYQGDAVLFRVRADRSRGELDYSDDEQNGWGGVVLGEIVVIDVPGTHTSLVEEPHVRVLAQSVRSVLDRSLRKLNRELDSSGELGNESRSM